MDSPIAKWFGALIKQPGSNYYKSPPQQSRGKREENLLVERISLDRLAMSSLPYLERQLTTMQVLHSHPTIVSMKVSPRDWLALIIVVFEECFTLDHHLSHHKQR